MAELLERQKGRGEMRKPRQIYTDEESKELDASAQQTFERIASGGIFLPWELCREMVEVKFLQEEAKELRGEVNKISGCPIECQVTSCEGIYQGKNCKPRNH